MTTAPGACEEQAPRTPYPTKAGTSFTSGWPRRTILEKAANLEESCPEWYLTLQHVALGEGWNLRHETELFERAFAAEPEYYYFARAHAYYLLPKWHGEEGDSENFAREIADRVGGSAGNVLYF